MSVTRTGKSIVMTAVNDAVTDNLLIDSLSLVGKTMVADDRLTIKDTGDHIVADYYVDGVDQNAEFIFVTPKWVHGLKLTAVPANGTWSVVARLK